ncbi:MAG: collagenase-like protease [Candidatus Margulisiibacteriota bacterium]|nr:MAG: collagenase-like protease [Candidatus Margulisiibacteriota bacterium]HCY36376.1 collagenase-like protease [Candidatus Margulisiibacteriota bacterium]
MEKIELLAPARNLECAIAAIKCGADAVYIGAQRFSARKSAANTLEDIAALVLYAHKYWSKVYVTINTILTDAELSDAHNLIKELYAIGTDAVIIQDMGLLELDLPPIPLFASTQCNNVTIEKIQFLEKVGFSRVILARELSLDQIKEIRAHTTIKLESFVHGALCVSYSGQCYLSCAIGGRSGNRGQCAQPCRKMYSLIDATGKELAAKKHLLSLKDYNASDYLEELLAAGITSFKIEGRLKDVGYTKNIVRYYREKIDGFLDNKHYKKASSGTSQANFVPAPSKTFNRGYTDYFLKGRTTAIHSPDTPKSIGEYIGKVCDLRRNSIIIDSDKKLHNGDGICFFDDNGQLGGTLITRVEDPQVMPQSMSDIKIGTAIYRNADIEFENILKSAKIERKINVSFTLKEKDTQLQLSVIDEDGTEAAYAIEMPVSVAQNPQVIQQKIKEQLQKLGDTIFRATEIDLGIDPRTFIPISAINEMRRQVISQLILARETAYPVITEQRKPNNVPYPEKSLDYRGNVFNESANTFYIRHGVEQIDPAAETGIPMAGKRVMTTKLCLKYQLGLCSKQGNKVNYEEPLFLVDEMKKKYQLHFNCERCEMELYFSERVQ